MGERGVFPPFSTLLRTKEPRDMPVERFMSALRLENRGKLNYLGLEIGTNVLKFDD